MNVTPLGSFVCMQVGEGPDGQHSADNQGFVDLGHIRATPVQQCRCSGPVSSWDLVGLWVEVPVGLGGENVCRLSVMAKLQAELVGFEGRVCGVGWIFSNTRQL